jgi:hypothetical protein
MTWHPDMPEEYRNQIVTGDARELAKRIPDESVDLIFTDPVYSEHDLYDLLAEIAARVLRPGGALLVWSNGRWHRENTNWLEAAGLTYRWDFGCVSETGPAPMNGKIIAKTNRLIWMESHQSQMRGYLADGYLSRQWSAGGEWEWTKNPRFVAQAIEAFTATEAIVLDPFTGGGTVPAVCKMLGRNYVAFEIDPTTAERARERVAITQVPWTVALPEQMTLDAALLTTTKAGTTHGRRGTGSTHTTHQATRIGRSGIRRQAQLGADVRRDGWHERDAAAGVDRRRRRAGQGREGEEVSIVTRESLERVAADVIELVLRKNADYGDAFKRHGVVGCLVRMSDKALRLEHLSDGREALVVDEQWCDTLRDIAGYALLGLLLEGK